VCVCVCVCVCVYVCVCVCVCVRYRERETERSAKWTVVCGVATAAAGPSLPLTDILAVALPTSSSGTASNCAITSVTSELLRSAAKCVCVCVCACVCVCICATIM
jgi:hypothetical protein